MPIRITSAHNPQIKSAIKLRDRRQRDKQRRIIIDGLPEITRAVAAGVAIEKVFVLETAYDRLSTQPLLQQLSNHGCETLLVIPPLFAKLAYGSREDGIVVVAVPPVQSLEALELPRNPLVAVLESIEKPGNVGAIARSADGAGVSCLILANPLTDPYNPNSIRASLGAVFSLPVCMASSREALSWVRERGVSVYAARIGATRRYFDVPLAGPAAFVLGNETRGLSEVWRGEVLDISLPQCGTVDSLNVSATAAVLFYEALRQRLLAANRTSTPAGPQKL